MKPPLNRDKTTGRSRGWRERRGEMLFIDARKMGAMVSRVHREFTGEDLARIASTYHAWRGEQGAGEYVDVAGFCASATVDEVAEHRYVLTPGRYVGAEEAEEDDEPLNDKIARLTKELFDAFEDSDRLQIRVRAALERLDA